MSIQAIGWAWRQEASGNALLVLVALADFSDDDGVCWPSLDLLASKAKCSRRTCIRILADLEERGLLARQKRGALGGGRASNRYQLALNGQCQNGTKPPLSANLSPRLSAKVTPPLSDKCDRGYVTTVALINEPSLEPSDIISEVADNGRAGGLSENELKPVQDPIPLPDPVVPRRPAILSGTLDWPVTSWQDAVRQIALAAGPGLDRNSPDLYNRADVVRDWGRAQQPWAVVLAAVKAATARPRAKPLTSFAPIRQQVLDALPAPAAPDPIQIRHHRLKKALSFFIETGFWTMNDEQIPELEEARRRLAQMEPQAA